MSHRGNCHDNAVAESFFQLLKREQIKKKIYESREQARSAIIPRPAPFNELIRDGQNGKTLSCERLLYVLSSLPDCV